jgi:GNAT superfamily N-acetyltransferase
VVGPEGWGPRGWSVAILCEVCVEMVIGDDASLFEAGHSLPELHVDPAIRGEGVESILVQDFIREELEGEAHVFVASHGSVIVKVYYVKGHELGTGGGEGAVEEALAGGAPIW